jgi:transposase
LADLLRTDGHRFTPLAPQSDDIRALRALVRGRDDLVATRVQVANQLRCLLQSFWPGAEIFADIDSPIGLAFIQRYPTPESASRLGPKRMAAFCAQHAYSGRRSTDELLARLHQAPAVVIGELEMEAKGELALSLAHILARLVAQIRLLTSRIEHHVGTLDDGRLLMSFPRAGQVCAAQILAELGSVRERFDSDEHLAAEAGVAPRYLRFRQEQSRHLPLGLQPPPARRLDLHGRQLPPRQPLGRPCLYSSARSRLRSPARHSHPLAGLAARDLARLDRSQTLRPHSTSRRPAAA